MKIFNQLKRNFDHYFSIVKIMQKKLRKGEFCCDYMDKDWENKLKEKE